MHSLYRGRVGLNWHTFRVMARTLIPLTAQCGTVGLIYHGRLRHMQRIRHPQFHNWWGPYLPLHQPTQQQYHVGTLNSADTTPHTRGASASCVATGVHVRAGGAHATLSCVLPGGQRREGRVNANLPLARLVLVRTYPCLTAQHLSGRKALVARLAADLHPDRCLASRQGFPSPRLTAAARVATGQDSD